MLSLTLHVMTRDFARHNQCTDVFEEEKAILPELDRDHEASEQAEMSASRRKIQLQETVEAEEIDEEKWTKLKGRSIVSACRFSQRDVNIMENVLSQNGLGSSWIIRCQNESCLPWFQRRFIRREER